MPQVVFAHCLSGAGQASWKANARSWNHFRKWKGVGEEEWKGDYYSEKKDETEKKVNVDDVGFIVIIAKTHTHTHICITYIMFYDSV